MAQMRLESWEGLKGLQRSHGHEACVYEMIRSVFFLPLGVVQRRVWKVQSLARVWCNLGKGQGRCIHPAFSLWVSEA